VLYELGIRRLPIESGGQNALSYLACGGGTAGSLFYEGWHNMIAANKAAAKAQTKISTHWSRVIRGSIEKGPTPGRWWWGAQGIGAAPGFKRTAQSNFARFDVSGDHGSNVLRTKPSYYRRRHGKKRYRGEHPKLLDLETVATALTVFHPSH
jgi:hypothetical protein